MTRTTCFYVIKLKDDKFYRRNHESCGGVRPTSSVIFAEQYSSLEACKEKFNILKNKGVEVVGIARFGLLNGEML